jgi:hypothetical protein
MPKAKPKRSNSANAPSGVKFKHFTSFGALPSYFRSHDNTTVPNMQKTFAQIHDQTIEFVEHRGWILPTVVIGSILAQVAAMVCR